jgi:hypothetical protein
MSAVSPDSAQQRLNYFNGQRLVANDLRTEQGYHIGMRRVLNRSLYSPGIVVGLEVLPAQSNPPNPQDKHRVVVKRGLAFDNLGREIFLPVDVTVQVTGTPRSAPGVVFGNLLVVSYLETRQFPLLDGCAIGAPYQPCSGNLAWGAPTRIVADAVFEFLDSWPSADSGKIVLSQIELDNQCTVVRASPTVRQYAVATKLQLVQPIGIEGESDIAQNNRKTLYFHIEGGVPELAVLHLRGAAFNTLYYSELGRHAHAAGELKTDVAKYDFTHTHLGGGTTNSDGLHLHNFIVDDHNNTSGGIDVDDTNGTSVTGNNPIQPDGAHTHSLAGLTINPYPDPSDTDPNHKQPWKHSHSIVGDSDAAGAAGSANPRNGPQLTLLADLVVKLDSVDITKPIGDQLEVRDGPGSWLVLQSDGSYRLSGNPLNTHRDSDNKFVGTGAIDLLKLGVEIGIGQHVLEFIVSDPDVGGQIQYNLYIG